MTPSPPYFVKVSKWNIINEAGLEFWSDLVSPSWESIWNQIFPHDGLTWSDQNSSLASLITFHLETIHKLAGAIAEIVFVHIISSGVFVNISELDLWFLPVIFTHKTHMNYIILI